MPKLGSSLADKVEEAEGGNFEAIPEGIYHAVLEGEVEAAEGSKGPYWKWTFKVTDEGFSGRKIWVNTSLAENALWKLKEIFEAFGVPTDTDTEDLIGKPVKLYLVQRIIEQGNRKGDMGNDVKQVLPFEDVDPAAAKARPTKKGSAAAKPEELALF